MRRFECSECGAEFNPRRACCEMAFRQFAYCPFCGAKGGLEYKKF